MNKTKSWLISFYNRKDLLMQLVQRDIRLKYRRSFLGYLWSIMNPLLIMIILEPEMKYLYPATFCFSSAITNGSFKSVKCTMMEATVYNTFRKLLPSSHAGVSMNNLNSCFKDHRKGALPFFTSS